MSAQLSFAIYRRVWTVAGVPSSSFSTLAVPSWGPAQLQARIIAGSLTEIQHMSYIKDFNALKHYLIKLSKDITKKRKMDLAGQ